MYVCMCNGFTEREVQAAIQEMGAKDVHAVHQSCCGEKPQCGKCAKHIQGMLSEEKRN